MAGSMDSIIDQLCPTAHREYVRDQAVSLYRESGGNAPDVLLKDFTKSPRWLVPVLLLLACIAQETAQAGDESTAYKAAFHARELMRGVDLHAAIHRNESILAALNEVVKEIAEARRATKRQRRDAGQKSGESRRETGLRQKIVTTAQRMRKSRDIELRSLSGRVATATNAASGYVRSVLQEEGILPKKKRA